MGRVLLVPVWIVTSVLATFVLLRFGTDAPDVVPIVQAAALRSVPLKVVSISDPAIARLYERKLVLVRPDGHVAWRADAPPTSAIDLIDRVRGAAPEPQHQESRQREFAGSSQPS